MTDHDDDQNDDIIISQLPGYDRIREHIADCAASGDHPQHIALAFLQASIVVALHYGADEVAHILENTLGTIVETWQEVAAEQAKNLQRPN